MELEQQMDRLHKLIYNAFLICIFDFEDDNITFENDIVRFQINFNFSTNIIHGNEDFPELNKMRFIYETNYHLIDMDYLYKHFPYTFSFYDNLKAIENNSYLINIEELCDLIESNLLLRL